MREYKAPSYRFLWQFLNKNIAILKAKPELSKEVLVVPAPAGGGTASVTITVPETIITFSGSFAGNCTLEINAPNSNIGDKLYVIVTNDLAGPITITAAGDLDWVTCASPGDPWIAVPGTTAIFCIFDGVKFIGLPNC